MTKLIVAFAALSLLVATVPAKASTCNTYCSGYGNTRTCTTNCY